MRDADFVKIAKALADATRHRMLQEIRAAGELNCSEVCERFPLSQPTISHHIKALADAGLVRCRKQGQFHVISVDEDLLAEFAHDIGAPARATAPRKRARRSAEPSANVR